MVSVHRGQVLDQTNLNIYTRTPTKVLIDVAEISYSIYDVTTGSDVLVIGPVDALPYQFGTGSYYGAWTVPTGQSIGNHRIDWAFKLTPTSPQETFSEEFTVLGVTAGTSSGLIISPQDLYDEGLPTSYDSATVEQRIREAQALIESITKKTFVGNPNEVVYADGYGYEWITLKKPIVSIDKIEFREGANTWENISLNNFVFYDDQPGSWNDPTVAINEFNHDLDVGLEYDIFPKGRRNIRITGMFGWCIDREGNAPEDIKLATKLLVYAMINPIGTGEMQEDLGFIGLKRLEVDDSEHEWHGEGTSGSKTGIAQVDRILSKYTGGNQSEVMVFV